MNVEIVLIVVMGLLAGLMSVYAAKKRFGRQVRNKWTQLTEIEKTNLKHNQELKTRLSLTLDQLMNIGHEVRTPLTGILGFSSLIADEARPEHAEFLRLIDRNSQRLLTTLTSIFDFALTELGTLPDRREMVDVVKTVRNQADVHLPLAYEKGIQLVHYSRDPQIWVLLNPDYLERIIYHLIHNAVKFTQNGQVRIEVNRMSQMVEICIQDTGIGISASFMPSLFEPFRQESAGNDRDFEGSGLGLAVVKSMVDFMHGDISVESSPGTGSVFRVRFPVTISAPHPEVRLPMTTSLYGLV